MSRFRRRGGLLLLPCIVLLLALPLPDNAWAFYSFQDDFGGTTYTDKWKVTVAGTARVSESGGYLDVSMTSGGTCSTVTVRSTTPVLLDAGIAATIVLRPAEGASAGMMLKKDDNNFVGVVIGPEKVVIGNKESGQYVEQVAGSSTSYLGRDIEVEFFSCQFGQLFVSIDGEAAGEVANLALDTGELSLELISSYCAASTSTRHVYYDSVSAGETLCYAPGRVAGRVTDRGTGLGIPLAAVTTDSGGSGVTSPNGYYVLSAGEVPSCIVTVRAEGYSPQRAPVDLPPFEAAIKDWVLYPSCPSSVSPTGALFGAAGGQGSLVISMTQQAGCGMNWLAAGSDDWLALTSADFGTGSGALTYAVQPGAGLNWRNGTVEITGHAVRIAQEGSAKAAVPAGTLSWVYPPGKLPFFDMDPALVQPLSAGNLSGGVVDMDVGLPGFTGPVDIYLGFKMPDALSPEIWIIMPDLGVQPASVMVAPWKTAVTGPLYDGLYGEFPLSLLPAGRYDLYTLVTPAGRLDAYYLWVTGFTAP